MDDPALLYLEVYLWRFNYYSYRYPKCTYEEFMNALAVGVAAPFYLSKLFLPYFNEHASIVNISSSRDRMSQPQTESYAAGELLGN